MMKIQGDIHFTRIDTIPVGATKKVGKIVAEGESTGHAHRFMDTDTIELYKYEKRLFVRVLAPATIIHDEHNPIPFEKGDYEIKRQREYQSGNMVKIIVD